MASLLAPALVLLTACGSGPPTSAASDAAVSDATVDLAADIRPGPMFTQPSCVNARTVCEKNSVVACVGGQRGEILEPCTEACSLGRCTTTVCAIAERSLASSGCRFYGVQLSNIDSDADKSTMVILTNSGATVVEASVEFREPGDTWTPVSTVFIRPMEGVRISIKRPLKEQGPLALAGAYRIESKAPVFAVQIVSDDADRDSLSSAGTVLRPAQALGVFHRAVTAPAQGNASVALTPGSRGGAGVITVVATSAATNVRVDLSTAATIGGSSSLTPAPPSFDMPMEDGDVLQIFSATVGGDLTGTAIQANAPVAVFTGNVYTTYGYATSGQNGGDLSQEQLPPVSSWGKRYVGARLSPAPGCKPFFGAGAGMWRIVAAFDNTEVTLVRPPGVSIDWPGFDASRTFTLKAGAFQSFFARPGQDPSSGADFLVQASEPILLAQFLDCEPGLSWGIDTRLERHNPVLMKMPPGFDQEVVILRKHGTDVWLGKNKIPDAAFNVSLDWEDGRYDLARLSRSDLSVCRDVLDACEDKLSGDAFGVTWRGMDVVCSYSLTVPPEDGCALPGADCNNLQAPPFTDVGDFPFRPPAFAH